VTGNRLTVGSVTDRLAAAGCVAADEEATELVAAAGTDTILEAFVSRRERGEPLAWITGTSQFCGHTIRVDPGVYVPRAQSEDLARRAATLLAGRETARAADLCTGCGAVAVHLIAAVPAATVVGVDADQRAAACARRNGVPTVVGDLGRPLAPRAFDVVTAVAPYVPTADLAFLPSDVQRYEPRRALDGGEDGLDVMRDVVRSAAGLLRPGGWLLTEIGGDQDRRLARTLHHCGFDHAATWLDEDGDLRGLAARLSGTGSASGRWSQVD
jgi:release factor glutamine methyltransferase